MSKSLRLSLLGLLSWCFLFSASGQDAIVWYESFNQVTGIGGNDGVWIDITSSDALANTDREWTAPGVSSASQCACIGEGGYLKTKGLELSGNGRVYFRAESWGDDTDELFVKITDQQEEGMGYGQGVLYASFIGVFLPGQKGVTLLSDFSDEGGGVSYNIAKVEGLRRSGAFTDFVLEFKGLTLRDEIMFYPPAGKRVFIDEVRVEMDPPESIQLSFTDDMPYTTLFYHDVGFILPEGLEASIYNIQNDGIFYSSHLMTAGDYIPPCTPVVLRAERAGTYTMQEVYLRFGYSLNDHLIGNEYEELTYWPEDLHPRFYRLRKKNGRVGFFYSQGCPDGGPFLCPAHQCYWVACEDEPGLDDEYIIDDGTTGMESIKEENGGVRKNALYNLNGQRVDDSYRGVVIQNRRIVIAR